MEKGISLKKGLLIIWSLLCTVSACAIGYATPYKGSAHSGYIHTSAPVRSSRSTMGLAQAPMASMSTTSSMSRGISYNEPSSTPAVQGIYTSASQISGGVMASTTYAQMSIRRAKKEDPDTPPSPGDDGYCPGCAGHYVWDSSLNHGRGGWICSSCGCELKDGCDCEEEYGYCWCPIDFNWAVALFMTALAAAYAVCKKRTQTVQ